jgi:hypothetical protein
MKFNISNAELSALNDITNPEFPKYTSQLINWANQNAQGTRPRIVGQLSDLFPEYQASTCNIDISDWEEWYTEKYPDAIEEATDKIFNQVENLKEAIKLIDKSMVRKWVEDLVISKTFSGMYVQRAILAKISDMREEPFRLASPEEESKGIDGYVGDTAYSIKPVTYKTMGRLSESIDIKMIYYSKKKSGLLVETEE